MGGAGRHAAICQASHITGPPRWRRYYYLLDAQNSVAVITDQNGGSPENDAYDAWGMRRRPNGSDAGFYNITSQSARGYSGQYQVTNNLIDLNARYYDALLGRFLGVDPMTGSDPFDLQNWNAYSYADNNPMAFSDPTGLCKGVFGCIAEPFNAAFHWVQTVVRHNAWLGQVYVMVAATVCSVVATPAAGAGCAAVATAEVNLLEGQQIGKALEGGAIAGAEALAFNAVGGATGGGGLGIVGNPGEYLANVAGHAIVGGTFSVIQGGKFGSGALAAGFSTALKPYLGDLGAGDTKTAGGIAMGTAVSAVVGGTASVLGGGKFANGAETAAFGYLFNEAAHLVIDAHVPSFLQKSICGRFGVCSASYSVGVAISYPGLTAAPYDAGIITTRGEEGGVDIGSKDVPGSWSKWLPAIFDVSFGKSYGNFSTLSGRSYSTGLNLIFAGGGEVFTPQRTPYGTYFHFGEVGIGQSSGTSSSCIHSFRGSAGC